MAEGTMAKPGNHRFSQRRRIALLAGLAMLVGTVTASAEQMQRFGDWEVHYVVLPSGFLTPEIASRYGIIRGRGRAFVNVSVLDPHHQAARVAIGGHAENLLGQRQNLHFREVAEGDAIYYLAEIHHTDQETLRFRVEISATGRAHAMKLAFQQKLYAEEP